ncbi:hypothetical protein N7532_001775 [Penicillium argentinense]|uniref:DNA replication regulator SLD2 n=1 Tax=Penicillium argentinense TaxID=1131581 RepID=A0A9W9KM41_9EURO|nr:uncharacterized protein N7532_001775 [Penicillium argentinense]KAJ5111240.1 hypothetical protein N7532_001775 [Penicillium argentinense]
MADHALGSRAEAAEKASTVRTELKAWEKEFAAANGGRKAGREDIKQNEYIAAKYKEYGQLKNLEAKLNRRENRQTEPPNSHFKKRKHASSTGPADAPPNSATPRKSAKGLFATPSQKRTERIHPSNLDPYDSPSTFRKLFSPSTHKQSMPAPSPLKTAIGPTPQRDGKTLGLFDFLSESGGSQATPSAKRQGETLEAGFRTPSKPKTFNPLKEVPEEEEEESARVTRTPASSTKQFYLANLFATPTTMRYAAMVEADDEKEAQGNSHPSHTEASPETNHSATPTFLRRSNSGRYPAATNNDGSGLSPMKSRQPGRFHGKGLSTIVQSLRDMEEERMDDDWDVMREMEAEEEGFGYPIPESQPAPEEGQRPYKKKGQKRTTRRVIMRPVTRQPKSRQESEKSTAPQESDDELTTAVPETQVQAAPEDIPDEVLEKGLESDDAASLHTMSEPESEDDEPDVDSDGDPEYGEKPKPMAKPKSFSDRLKEAVSKVKPKAEGPPPAEPAKALVQKEEKKPKERKVNPQSHANYRSLKIGNRSSRGRGRFRGRR